MRIFNIELNSFRKLPLLLKFYHKYIIEYQLLLLEVFLIIKADFY